jgi:ribosomal protein L16/L10AE
MDKQSNSTPAFKSLGELTENIVRDLRAKKDLHELFEKPLNNAERMASILANLLEASLGKDMSSAIGDHGKDTYHLTKVDREDILFSIYKVQDEIKAINAAFEEAIH